MRATLRQLRLLKALADTGSVTGAAQACHVTQPTVSMQLRELADSVGLPLYEQVGRRLHLTAAGQAVLATARAMLDEWESLEQRIAAMKGIEQGRLRVSIASTAKYFVPRMLGRFCSDHPGIDITLQVLNRDGVVGRLRDNLDDLYVLSRPPQDIAHRSEPLLSNPLVVIAARGHPLAGSASVRWKRLQTEPFILREPGSGTRLATDAHFATLGLQPRVRLELGSNEAIKQAVAAGMGLGVVSRHALAARPSAEGLAILPVQRFPVPSSWSVLWPEGKRLTPAALAFVQHLKQASADWPAHA
ncbi:MAG: LysR family transcriptional regulator [Rubrivivax sp.]